MDIWIILSVVHFQAMAYISLGVVKMTSIFIREIATVRIINIMMETIVLIVPIHWVIAKNVIIQHYVSNATATIMLGEVELVWHAPQ